MKRVVVAAFTAALLQHTQAFGGPLSDNENKSIELPLKRVVLSTAGLAQFTHGGEVTPGTSVELSVRLDQVDDLLKSLTIFDREGAVGAVSLPGKAPLTELFRDLPFGPEALSSPATLLNALVGAEVEIEGPVSAKGRVFRVEEERTQLTNGTGTLTHHRLSLMTENGLVQAVLEDLTALRFTEPLTKAQVDRALTGLAQNRAKDRRTLSISLLGDAKREAGFSYVVAAPVWKTAYRLVLPQENGKARLQGWGIVENLTGSDWKDVDLSLISGNPVALKQQLYTAFYADRPEIPVTVASRFVPKKDESESLAGRLRVGAAAPEATAPAPMMLKKSRAMQDRSSAAPAEEPAMAEQISTVAVAAESEEAATQVLYHFPTKITLSSGSSMMVPFVDQEFSAVRTWFYQPDTNPNRPFAAVRLKNDGTSTLPAGLITAFDHNGNAVNFVGDAQLPMLPKSASRFITFALDSKTDIRRTDLGIKETRLGKIANGQLTLSIKSRWNIDYEIASPTEEDREIVIDEARRDGWKLASDMKGVEETTSRLRYTVAAPKGVTTKASLRLERLDYQTVALDTMEPEALFTVISGLQNESPALNAAVAKLATIVSEITKANSKHEELEEEREKISTDQERLRKNLGTVGQNTDLGQRYLKTMKEQEDRLIAIAESEKSLAKELENKRSTAQQIASTLVLE